MFTFLRSFDLVPLEWEQAVRLTAKTAPSTLEVISAGLEFAQAVVVLMTGDDLAQLKPQYGKEPHSPQPRPNVIFEAGWSLAKGGEKRTILISFGSLRGFSDLSGINFVELDNSSSARMKIISRLQSADCNFDIIGKSDFLSPASGGDFEAAAVDIAEEEPLSNLFDRGNFTEFIADSALHFARSSFELQRQLIADLKAHDVRVDLRYHYMGTLCAERWLDLSRHPEYGHTELLTSLRESVPKMVNELLQQVGTSVPIDVVSLGSGDGRVDEAIIYALSQKVRVAYYYCIDISFELLQEAVKHIVGLQWFKGKKIRVKAIHGDFTEVAVLAPIFNFDPSINLFVLCGYTLGNYDEGTLLGQVHGAMTEQDLLFLDARLHDIRDWSGDQIGAADQERIKKHYAHPENELFAFGPIEIATMAKTQDVVFAYDVTPTFTVVPRSIRIITQCCGLNTRFRHTGELFCRPRLRAASTTVYSFPELSSWLSNQGFRVVWSERAGDTGFFLLQKRVAV
jgi:hypothetical protein